MPAVDEGPKQEVSTSASCQRHKLQLPSIAEGVDEAAGDLPATWWSGASALLLLQLLFVWLIV
jgi:hypothetical protein